MNVTADNVKAVGIGAGLLLAAYVGYKAYTKGAQAVTDVAQAVNPLNHDNIFAGAVNAVGEAVSEPDSAGMNADGSWSLGGWIFDVTHPDTAQAVKDISKPVSTTTGSAPGEAHYDEMGNVIGVW